MSSDEYRKLGNQHFSTGDYEVALALYTQAIAEETQDDAQVLHHCNRSACYLAMEQAEDAASDARVAMQFLRKFMSVSSQDTVKLCQYYAKVSFRLAKALLMQADEADYEQEQRLLKETKSVLKDALKFMSQYTASAEDELCKTYRSHLMKLGRTVEEQVGIVNDGGNGQKKSKKDKVGIRDFELQTELGTGNFSRVVVAQHKQTKKKYALKIIEKKKAESLAKRQHPNVYNEIQMERRVLLEKLVNPSHKFVIKMHAAFQDYYSLYYLMDLHHDLSNPNILHAELWESTRYKNFSVGAHFSLIPGYIAEVLEAIQYCHSKGIVHRDLKPENVLLQENGHICLIDFGTAKDMNQTDLNGPEFVGTPEYMSPEAVKGSEKHPDYPCGVAIDYWALGVMMYNLHTGITSFSSPSQYLAFLKIRRGLYPHPDCIPVEAWDLIKKLLVVEPSKRLGGRDVKDKQIIRNHCFFQSSEYTKGRVGKLSELSSCSNRVPTLVDLCIRVASDKLASDAMSFDHGEVSQGYKNALPFLKPVAEDSVVNPVLARRQIIRFRIMHVLERMFCLSNVRIRRNFYSSKQDMRLKRIRPGTRDFVGMSHSEQRHVMKQAQQQNEAMPGEEPEQAITSFVYLTSKLLTSDLFSMDESEHEGFLAILKKQILAINKLRPNFVMVNSNLPPEAATRKLLGKISETIPVVLNDGSVSKGFSVYPTNSKGCMLQAIALHFDRDENRVPTYDCDTLDYIKGEMEANSVSGCATLVSSNIDPRRIPTKILRRLRYGKVLFAIGPNSEKAGGVKQDIWVPDDGGYKSDDDSDTNSLCGDDMKDENEDDDDDHVHNPNKEKKILRRIASNKTTFFRIFEEDLIWKTEDLKI